MVVVTCTGIDMYDPRHTVKAVAGENLLLGICAYIADDGLAYAIDDGFSAVCHGVTLTPANEGDSVVLANVARMRVETTQTPGDMLYTGAETAADPNGSAPNTETAGGVKCGYAITTELVYFHTNFPPDADTENK